MSAAASALMCAACSTSPQAGCSLVGASDYVEVDFDHGMVPDAWKVSLTVCLDERCATSVYRGGVRRLAVGPLGVSMPVPADATVAVRAKLKAHGRVLFAGNTMAHTHKYQPNGPHCDPTVWRVRVQAHEGGQLTPA